MTISTNKCFTSKDVENNDMNNMIKYCASQFYSFSIDELSQLGRNTFHAILSSETFAITSEDALLMILIELGSEYYEYWEYLELCFLSSEGISRFIDSFPFEKLTSKIWEGICDRLKQIHKDELRNHRFVWQMTSKILTTFPTVLNEFKSKQARLIYRGSDDGFGSSNFHSKCDGISNTITIILTTDDFIFGGFTPIPWDSTEGYRSEASGGSFLFSVKNPHNRDFGRIELAHPTYAIYSKSSYGPTFGYGHDIYIANHCNANSQSSTNVGYGYMNNTGINQYQVFTGTQHFTVKEIEVFTFID
jgi:hypothetical protein